MLASINTPGLFLVMEEEEVLVPAGCWWAGWWDGGEERRGTVWRSKGGGEGMCDDMRCEVFPDSVITCIKDSLRERDGERDRGGEEPMLCCPWEN